MVKVALNGIALVVFSTVLAGLHPAQQEPIPTLRLVRSGTGPRGSEAQGDYRLEEERTTFSRTTDRQVVAYFQWDGAPGVHRLAGSWRGPDGTTTRSEFDYTARNRLFGAYWNLPLSESTPLGDWWIDVTVDGQPAGRLAIRVVDSGDVPPSDRRRLSPAEVFNLLDRVYVDMERVVAGRAEHAAGVVVAPGVVATAFAAVNAADRLRILAPGGPGEELTSLAGWNHRQDWALFMSTASAGPQLATVKTEDVNIGDRCYSMIGGASGSRRLAECAVVGRVAAGGGGTRFIITSTDGADTPGAPVVNENAALIGIIGGGLTPAAAFDQREMWRERGQLRGVPVVPIALVRAPTTGAVTPISELRTTRVLVGPVTGSDHIVSAGFARDIARDHVVDQRREFSTADENVRVFVSWSPQERLRGQMTLLAYDEDNRVVGQSKPRKTDLRPGNTSFTQWELPVPAPGHYRVDVHLDNRVLWRGYFVVR